MDNIFVIMRPDGTPFHRDDAMGILATDSEAQAIRFQHAREEEGAEYVRYMRTQPPSAASVSERARELVKRWRHEASTTIEDDSARELASCADELESLLSAASGEGGDDTKRLDWIARQGGYEFDFGILNDQPGDGDWFVHGMVGSGQGATFRDAIDAAIKEEAGGQDANTDILDTLAFKTENGDAGRGSVTYIALVASGEADHQQNAAQGGGAS